MGERPGRTLAAVLAALFLVTAAVAAPAGRVTLYRDTWGVPHIFGETAEAAMYAHGYAQAEDRLEDVLRAYREAEGRAAAILGEDWVERDLVARMARHAQVARERYTDVSAEGRRLIEFFVAGVRRYMAEHPERVPDWAEPPRPRQVVALYRAFIWSWPWGQGRGDVERAGSHVTDGRGSNQWVVGPSRSAENAVLALIDPHLSWQPTSRFYEAHVHGGPFHFFGFSIIGTPIMALGHTDVLSLAATTGGPDCADAYEERIDPGDPLRYAYDGEWRTIDVETVDIEVATEDGPRVERRRIERTHHGPIVARQGDRAWAIKTAYDAEVGIFDQWMRMVQARDLGEFLHAMQANQALPQNIMYGDVYGQTYYVRAGRVPVRPEGYATDRPLPGWTSDSEWRGIHPFTDLVQILNPPGGVMQNCNVSPGTMMPRSPLTADRYPACIYNARTDRSNSRGRRALDLLGATRRITLEQALRFAVDTRVQEAGDWQARLAAAFAAHRERFAGLAGAVRLLAGWDGRMDVDSRGAALFRTWVRACRREGSGVDVGRVRGEDSLPPPMQVALLDALAAAVDEMERTVGRIDPTWGEVHRVRRGDRDWPVGGCNADGIKTLRSVRGSPPDEKGVSWVRGGQMCTTVVLLREGAVRSYSVTPFGQSNDPRSPHFTDQGERLFSRGELKPTWFDREELSRHVESERTFLVPDEPL